MRYQLTDEAQAKVLMTGLWPKVIKALQAGKQLSMEIKDAAKSRDQEKLYHELIGQIAKQAQHMGSHWDAETWKRLLVDKYVRETGLNSQIMANLDANGLVQLGFQTRNFTKEQASEFVEFLMAWASQNGVELKDE